MNMRTQFDQTLDSTPFGTFQGVGPESLQNNRHSALTESDQEALLMETPLQHGNSTKKLTLDTVHFKIQKKTGLLVLRNSKLKQSSAVK